MILFLNFFPPERNVLQKRDISFLACTKGPAPPPCKRKCLPPWTWRGSNTRLRVRGWGDPIRTTGKNARHSWYTLLWLRLWAGRQWKRQSSWTQWTSTPSASLPQPSPRLRLLLVQGQSENFAFNLSIKDSTLQRKSHFCISFLGIARPQSKFPHSFVCERFIQ